MTIPHLNRQQSILKKTEENKPLLITADFLRGGSIEDITSYLQNLSNRHQASALELFQKSNDEQIINDVINLLVPKDQVQLYQSEYQAWLDKKYFDHNLIHLLEFLALKDFHRLHFFLKIVYKIKPAANYQYIYGGLALSTCGAALAFYLRPDWWNIVLDAIIVTAPSVGLWLLKYILIPQNLAALLIGYKLIETFINIYLILNNHSTSNEHKTTKILRQLINCAFITSAQILCFMSLGVITQAAGTLFITAALFEMLWALQEYCQLTKPQELNLEPQQNILFRIHDEDQMSYYKRKEQQLFVAVVVLVLISAATTISILFGGQFIFISLLSIIFQWLVSRFKETVMENTENHNAQKLQESISTFFPPRSTVEDSEKLDNVKMLLHFHHMNPQEKIQQLKELFPQDDFDEEHPKTIKPFSPK